MCVLIAAPSGVKIPADNMRFCNDQNPHGVGMVWLTDGKIERWRTANPNDIESAIRVAQAIEDHPRLIHFRFGTSGSRTEPNVHPFQVDDDLYMAHNGVLSIRQIGDYSDTRMFAEHVLGNLKPLWWRDEVCREQIERLLNGDRMALLHRDDGIILLNAHRFHKDKDDGAMYSHSNYKPYSLPYKSGDTSRGGGYFPRERKVPEPSNPYRTRAENEVARGHTTVMWEKPVKIASETEVEFTRRTENWTKFRERQDAQDKKRTADASRTPVPAVSRKERRRQRARITNTKQLDEALDDAMAGTDEVEQKEQDMLYANVEVLFSHDLDPVIAYFVYTVNKTPRLSETICAKCVDADVAKNQSLATPFMVSDVASMFQYERCAKCDTDLLDLAASVAAKMVTLLNEMAQAADEAELGDATGSGGLVLVRDADGGGSISDVTDAGGRVIGFTTGASECVVDVDAHNTSSGPSPEGDRHPHGHMHQPVEKPLSPALQLAAEIQAARGDIDREDNPYLH